MRQIYQKSRNQLYRRRSTRPVQCVLFPNALGKHCHGLSSGDISIQSNQFFSSSRRFCHAAGSHEPAAWLISHRLILIHHDDHPHSVVRQLEVRRFPRDEYRLVRLKLHPIEDCTAGRAAIRLSPGRKSRGNHSDLC